MVISPQFGHGNFVASLRGGIVLLQLVQTVKANVLCVICVILHMDRDVKLYLQWFLIFATLDD